MKELVRVTANFSGKSRPAVLEGRDYMVYPATILVQGVHKGSNGAVFYDIKDIATYVQAWNHKPIVVNHPKQDGQFVSADDPAILETHKVGFLMKNAVEGEQQGAEAWLEKSRLKKIDSVLYEDILAGKTIEVSTGLFSDNEKVAGEWNGEKYDMIARNYRPDHLALLPNSVGACSCSDGCGMFTAAQAADGKVTLCDSMLSAIKDLMAGKSVTMNCEGCNHGKPKETLMSDSLKKKVDSLIASKAFEDSDREWLESLEEKRLDKVISGIEAEAKMKANAEAEAKAKAEAEAKAKAEAEALANEKKGEKKEEPTTLQLNTLEDVMKHTSGPVRESLIQGINALSAEHKRLIDIILSNENNQFEEAELQDEVLFTLDRLRKFAHSMTVVESQEDPTAPAFPSYLGANGAPQFQANKTTEKPLGIPKMDFSSRK